MDSLSVSTLKKLRTEIEALCGKGEVPGVECAMFSGDRILFSYDYGQINKIMEIPSDLDSLYMIGSNTKMMTALCCMKLAEEGRLNLHADIREYLPAFSLQNSSAKITVEVLLQHRAGLVGDLFNLTCEDGLRSLPQALQKTEPTCAPGEMFSYSNLGYGILGLLIQHVTGYSYEYYVNQIIAEPLGIKIYFHKEERSRFSCAYDKKGQETEDFISSLPEISAGTCTYMSMADFLKFGQVFLNQGAPILKPQTMTLMESLPLRDPMDEKLCGYGYGLIHNQYCFPRVTVLGHGGDTMCHHSVFNYIKELGVGVAVMTNGAAGMALAGKLGLLMLRTALKEGGRTAVIPERGAMDQKISPAILGTFATMMGPLEIRQDSWNHLHTSIKGVKVRLSPAGGGWVHCTPGSLLTCVPALRRQIERIYLKPGTYQGKPVLLAVSRCRDFWSMGVLGVPFREAEIPASFHHAAGTYEPADPRIRAGLSMTVRLTEKDGKLLASVDTDAMKTECLLLPLDDSKAVIQGFGRYAGESVLLNSEENTLYFSGITLKQKKITE